MAKVFRAKQVIIQISEIIGRGGTRIQQIFADLKNVWLVSPTPQFISGYPLNPRPSAFYSSLVSYRRSPATFATSTKNVISLQNLGPFAPVRSASRLPAGVSANRCVQKCPGFAKSERVDVAKPLCKTFFSCCRSKGTTTTRRAPRFSRSVLRVVVVHSRRQHAILLQRRMECSNDFWPPWPTSRIKKTTTENTQRGGRRSRGALHGWQFARVPAWREPRPPKQRIETERITGPERSIGPGPVFSPRAFGLL